MHTALTRLPPDQALWRLRLHAGFAVTPNRADWQPLHDGPHSRIFCIDGPSNGPSTCIAKLARPRSLPRDAIRKYGACQGLREYRGHRILAAIGLRAAAVFGWGMTLGPAAGFESALFMERLPPFVSGLALIRQERDSRRRQRFLQILAAQLAHLHGSGYVHMDCHFGNFCVLSDGALVWLDNDIRRPRSATRLRRRFAKTLALLRTTARGAVTDREWQQFNRALGAALATTPIGARLRHEIS